MAKELDVNIGIALSYDSGTWFLYRDAIKQTPKGPTMVRSFTDPLGYSHLVELVEVAHSQFNDFGGENFVKILVDDTLVLRDPNAAEDLKKAIKRQMGKVDIYSAHFEPA
jgi:hypothetical protein